MKDDRDEIIIDGEIVNGTFSTRAPKIRMNPVRLLFWDATLFFVFKIFLFLFVIGSLIFVFWTKILGGIFLAIGLLAAVCIWRYVSLRKMEFKNAVLAPGIVTAQNPPTVLILTNMACGDAEAPVWAVELKDCRSLSPFSAEIGTRIPCVTAFLGSGIGGSWDKMVSNPLTSGTGDRKLLDEALARLDDEDEWRILIEAVDKKKFPQLGKTLRI